VKTDSEVGFVLHTRPYRETSLLVDLFTKNYGRVRCVAKAIESLIKKVLLGLFFLTQNINLVGKVAVI